jgi:bifunctional non-homologous end joining protein LigD
MLEPMFATLAEAPLDDPNLVYEPKYDGIRAIAEVAAGGTSVRLWSRLGNEKTRQFPEVADALAAWAKKRRTAVVLDGEIVALDAEGRPTGFQHLQGRIHVKEMIRARRIQPARAAAALKPAAPSAAPVSVAFVLFDLLRDGEVDWRERPLLERRAALERIVRPSRNRVLRVSEQVRGDGRAMQARAKAEGWEGLIAKSVHSRYRSGKRSADWRKLKIVHEQEFVIGGWTEPRNSRTHFGALLLGVYPAASDAVETKPRSKAHGKSSLIYVGHVGTGFDERALGRVGALLAPLETKTPPFSVEPATNEPAHWVSPTLVAQVRFSEWTADGILRHPVFLGLRDDKKPAQVQREEPVRAAPSPAAPRAGDETAALLERLQAIEDSRRDGLLDLPDGRQLKVTNLHKPFWSQPAVTKGDLFRYYVTMAPFVLPAIADRPLVMKRFPNGVAGKPFYQHRVDEAPDGVRIEPVAAADARQQLIGGDLLTLLYTTQLAAISQDPWFSRVSAPESADYVALDLDPAPEVSFDRVLQVARWIRDELARLGVTGVPKTSGADGLHIYIPLAAGTSYEAGALFAQIVATLVAEKHPKEATIERALKARGARVYVDYLQNAVGKTLASAYSVRASSYAGVSTPLSWEEVDRGVRREDFTLMTMPERVRSVGDLWAPTRTARGANLSRIVGRRR